MNPYIGHDSQIDGVEEHRLVGGKGDGMRLYEVNNGKGLELTITPDRAGDIMRLRFKGINMSYMSPCGYVAPAYYDDKESGWLKSFTAGFLTTCGLQAVGSPCNDEGEELPLHGAIGNTPSDHVYWEEEENAFVIHAIEELDGFVEWKMMGVRDYVLGLECGNCYPDGRNVMREKGMDGIHHGLVKPSGTALMYEDGQPCRPFGTTVYAMMHQPKELIAQTVDTLIHSPFNKVRTCVFPKHYFFNENEPELFAFEKKEEGGFDFHRPCFAFWDAFEEMIQTMDKHQIQVDLILFHPYDCWGFADMTKEDYLPYLNYLVARFAAFPNIWWSLANEYDCMKAFKKEDWDCIDKFVSDKDCYGHMLSCHHMIEHYDFSKANITHCSIQGDATSVEEFMKRFNKPVLIDECGYEGNIFCHWGHLSGFEMVNRLWYCFVMGGYGTHGETFMHPEDVLWWGKGGKLYGESPARIEFLKRIIDELPGALEPVPSAFVSIEKFKGMQEGLYQDEMTDFTRAIINKPLEEAKRIIDNSTRDTRIFTGHCGEDVYLAYYGRHCTAVGDIELPETNTYRVEVLDVWEMTRETILTGVNGKVELQLPGKEGVAVLATRM